MSNNRTSQDKPGLWNEPPSESVLPREGRRPKVPTEVEALWDVTKLSNYLGVPRQTIYAWRHAGKGPKGFRVGKHIRWQAGTVVDWADRLEREQ